LPIHSTPPANSLTGTLHLDVHADSDGVLRDVGALGPVSPNLLDQNLEELFFSAVEESRPAALEVH